MLEFTIEEASAKTRTGPPVDDEEDYALPVWAGVVPLHLRAAAPLKDPGSTAIFRFPTTCAASMRMETERRPAKENV